MSSSFKKLMEQLNIEAKDFISEVQFLLLTHYVGKNAPAQNQYIDYNSHRIRVTLGKTCSGTSCYFDIVKLK